MRYLVVYDESMVKIFEDREEAIEFYNDKLQDNINEYCNDYDIEMEDMSPDDVADVSWGASYESGDINLYDIRKILKNIAKANLDKDIEEQLIRKLKSKRTYSDLGEYEGLEEVLEYIDEEKIYY
ncbi:hypothetical protein [Clostridium perfringens]|uniref:hypothetical protein n=1 Tax=Clostridium perfringens TaxID=1502 RepID=UPI000E11B5B6|nr:hypothetical protein [Clostridium perfringens]STB10800.1 Uncharacterised protein [Clostridium novyi]SUY37875.1 Uncharacterised protein [Clostridium perfringens]